MMLKESIMKASSSWRSCWCFPNAAQRFIGNCQVVAFEAQQIVCAQHAFIFSSTAGTSGSERFPSFLLSAVAHICLCTLLYGQGSQHVS